MSVICLLSVIFVLLSVGIFRSRSFYLISGLFLNTLIFMGYLLAISLHIPVYFVTAVTFLLTTLIILYHINGVNVKTKTAFICVVFFLVLFTLVMIPLINVLKTQGFAFEELDELSGYDFTVAVPFTELNVSVILMSFSGAVVDGSMAICSSTYEIYVKKPNLTFQELLQSSFNVVIEALNSTIYTLLFAFLASNLALVIFLQDLNYSFSTLINSKMFVGELLISVLSGCAGIVILPFSAVIGSWLFTKRMITEKRTGDE